MSLEKSRIRWAVTSHLGRNVAVSPYHTNANAKTFHPTNYIGFPLKRAKNMKLISIQTAF